MTAPRLVVAMAALLITLHMPLSVSAHDSHASSIQHPHPGRAIGHAGQPLGYEDAQTYPILAARDADASPDSTKAGTSDSMLALLTAANIEKRQVPEGFPPEGPPDVSGSGSGSGSDSGSYSGSGTFDPYAGGALGSDGLRDILPVPTTWATGPTFPQTTAGAEIKTDTPSSTASSESSAVTSVAATSAAVTSVEVTSVAVSSAAASSGAATSAASSEASHAVSSDAAESYSGILTAPAPYSTTAKTGAHRSCSGTRVTGISGNVVPASTAIHTAVRTAGTPTAASSAPARESTGAAASLVMAGVPEGLFGTLLVSLGLWML